MSKQYRPTQLEINLENIRKNYQLIEKKIKPKKVIPVVKANAYGHGIEATVKTLIEFGAKDFAVALIEEALIIRKISDSVNILVMGVIDPDDFPVLSDNNIAFTMHNETLYHAAIVSDYPLQCHFKVDTGMNRLGFKEMDKVQSILNKGLHQNNLHIKGVYTHFATADSDKDFVEKQVQRFRHMLKHVNPENYPEYIHVSNSSAALKHETDFEFTTHARVGISLYGESLEDDVDYLYPAFKLTSRVTELKPLKKGEKVGYDITYEAMEDENIGIVPIGYADGIFRTYQNAQVMINNRYYRIIGRVCMDQMFIKTDENVKKNDIVVLLGEGKVSVENVSKRLNTIPHEILCSISSRVPRVYKK